MTAPVLYYWLFLNIIAFYILIAFGLSMWGAYICWEVDEEEAMIKKAMQEYAAKNFGDPEFQEKMRLAGWSPNTMQLEM